VPTLRVFGGLKRADWERWGQFTTVKANAAELLTRELRPHQRIYCCSWSLCDELSSGSGAGF